MKKITMMAVLLFATASFLFGQIGTTEAVRSGKDTIVLQWKYPPAPRSQQKAAPAKEPLEFYFNLIINQEKEQAPVYAPEKENNNGQNIWNWILTTAFLVLIAILATVWVLNRRRRYGASSDYDAMMLHFGSVDHDGFIQHNGMLKHHGIVRHEHFQMPTDQPAK